MAVLTAAQDLDLLSRPYDVQDPSAPDPSHPRVARVPGTVDRGGVSIFGGEGQVPGDDLDALFNDDHDITEPFRETVDFNQSVPMHLEDDEDSQAAAAAARRAAYAQEDRARDLDEPAPQGLGIDEEVKVRKPRAPIAKLDHDRLLGEKGIPKLQKIAKTKLKFRGKGHEFSDVAKMLSMYQLWLDDMFPKARFADGLSIIEKLGHSKRMQVMRKEWIDADRPKPAEPERNEFDDVDADFVPRDGGADEASRESAPETRQQQTDGAPDDDDLYAEPDGLFFPDSGANTTAPRPAAYEQEDEEPDADDLDALLADHDHNRAPPPQPPKPAPARQEPDEFADEMDAMEGMDWD